MICLSDNDLLLHLTAWNLLDEFQAFLRDQFGPSPQVYVLNSFVQQLRANPKWERDFTRGVLNRALRFCDTLNRVDSLSLDPTILESLQMIDDIDAGEAGLFAAALANAPSLVLTNDIRCLRALVSHPEAEVIRLALAGRCLHLRQVALWMCQKHGVAHVRRKMAGSNSDICICGAIGQSGPAETRLQNTIDDLARECGALLHAVRKPDLFV